MPKAKCSKTSKSNIRLWDGRSSANGSSLTARFPLRSRPARARPSSSYWKPGCRFIHSTLRALESYRQRKAPRGVKDDRLDAWSFSDALRVDGHGWKPLRPEDPLVKELRVLCRDEVALIEQRTAFINQLRHALAEYYP